MTDMKTAMKAGEKTRVLALRNMISALKARQIDSGNSLTEDEAVKLFQSMAKKLQDSVEQYEKVGRSDLAENERNELDNLKTYLPEQISEDELRQIVRDVIAEAGAESMADMRKVMPILMPKIAGKADGKTASNMVKELLSK